MRLPLALAILGLFAAPFLAPATSAAANDGHVLTDAKGDTVLESGTGAASAPVTGAAADCADLSFLDAAETEDAMGLTIGVTALKCDASLRTETTFQWHDMTFELDENYGDGTFGSFSSATLYRITDTSFQRVANLKVDADASKNTLATTIPKVYLMDAFNHTPNLGDKLANVKVIAEAVRLFSFGSDKPIAIRDDMPNSGDGGAITIQRGDFQSGHLFLTTNDRVRVSNGGATTFVFHAFVQTQSQRAEDVDLKVNELPPMWNATVQSPIRVAPGSNIDVPVLVSVPFAHEHGGYSSFNLTATSKSDPSSKAVLRMGVLHTPIPQPAGHHSEIFLHGQNGNTGPFATVFPFSGGYINTEAKHDNEPAEVDQNAFANNGNAWGFNLNPGLQIGVDFDMNRTGLLEGQVFTRATGSGTIQAKLYLTRASNNAQSSDPSGFSSGNNNQAILLAESTPGKVAFDLQQATPFKLTITPKAQADYIPYAKGQNLYLLIQLKDDGENPLGIRNACCIGARTSPTLDVKTFKMTLPLNEYNDALTGASDAGATLDLAANGPVEKLGRAGTTMTYTFDLKTDGKDPIDVDVEVAGSDAKLGELVPDGTVTLRPGQPVRLTLGVHIPENAADGQQIEVLVFAHAKDDPSKMAIERTKTTVGKGTAAIGDESEVLAQAHEAQKDTPGLGTSAALGVIALAAIAWRRR